MPSGNRVRVVYYTHTAFFEVAASIVRELARSAEVHLLLEVAPSAWRLAGFDATARRLPAGLAPADDVLGDAFPPAVRAYWSGAASFHLVAHAERRSLHPSTVRIGRRVLDFVRATRADVLHIDDVDVSPRLSLALPFARSLPIVLSVHDPVPHSGEHGWRKRLARRLAYPRARRFVLHNRSMVDAFRRAHGVAPDDVSVAPLGLLEIFREWRSAAPAAARPPVPPPLVGESRPAPAPQPPGAPPATSHPPTILFFGRISPYKGLDVLYRALPQVAERVPGVRVVVAGQPIDGYTPPTPPLLPPPARVATHFDYLPNAHLARLLEEATVVACPYRDATQSGVVLTAYAFDRPVVASAVGGLPEYVVDGETGVLVPPGDDAALADALVGTLERATRARDGGMGVLDRARRAWSWDRTAATLMDAYREVSRR